MPNSHPDNTQELEQILNAHGESYASEMSDFIRDEISKQERDIAWEAQGVRSKVAIQALITQSNLKAVEAFAANLLKWTDNNKHDLGEIGQFIRVRYVKTGIDQELAKLKENK